MPGLLGNIFSTIDTQKRKLTDLLGNPVESIQQIVGNVNDRARNLNELTAAAAQEKDLYGPKSQQLASLLAEAYNPIGLTVYHGSPAKFTKFDPTKIGSGEGAQAYGYGHYVAESPGVAKDYQRRLAKESQATDLNTKMQMVDVGGKPLTSFNVDMDASLLDAAKAGKKEFVNLAESKKARWESLSQDQSYPFQDYAKQKVGAYNSLLDAAKKSDVDYTGTGMFYEIDLPDEQIARMLDFDKPLMQQSKEIQSLAKQYGLTDADHMGGDLIAAMDAKRAAGAEAMRQAGVPGIRYLDQGSRATPNITNQRLADLYEKHQGNAEAAVDEMMRSVYNTPKKKQEMREAFLKQLEAKKTSNFVVFPGNEDLLTILKRNGGLLGP